MSIFPNDMKEFFEELSDRSNDVSQGIDLFRYGVWDARLLFPRVGKDNYDLPLNYDDFQLGHPLTRERVEQAISTNDPYQAHHNDPSMASWFSPVHKFFFDGWKKHWSTEGPRQRLYKRIYLQGEVCEMLPLILSLARNSLITQCEFFAFVALENDEGYVEGEKLISIKMHNLALTDLIQGEEVEKPWTKKQVRDFFEKEAKAETKAAGPGDLSEKLSSELQWVQEYERRCREISDPSKLMERASPEKDEKPEDEETPAEKRERIKQQRYRERMDKLKMEFRLGGVFGPSEYPIVMLELVDFGEIMREDQLYKDYVSNMEDANDTPF